jgi:Domain of unknown function (DUF4145)
MKCPHCAINFHDNWVEGSVDRKAYIKSVAGREIDRTGWLYRTALCPNPKCSKLTIEISALLSKPKPGSTREQINSLRKWRQVHPIGSNRGPVPSEVPKAIAADYVEASVVLPLSTKASAALSRRCLQAILNAHGFKGRDLAKQIDKLLKSRVLPMHIHKNVDVIRGFGNFSAHPITDKTTLQIIDVEPHEAEWCLEILEALFDHFYVAPEAARKKKAELDAKLKAAGRRPSK